MRAEICTSRLACFSSGIFGTSAALCAAGFVWLGVELFAANTSAEMQGASVAGTLLLFVPTSLSIALAGGLYLTRTQPGPIATIFTICGAAWTVLALNMWVSL